MAGAFPGLGARGGGAAAAPCRLGRTRLLRTEVARERRCPGEASRRAGEDRRPGRLRRHRGTDRGACDGGGGPASPGLGRPCAPGRPHRLRTRTPRGCDGPVGRAPIPLASPGGRRGPGRGLAGRGAALGRGTVRGAAAAAPGTGGFAASAGRGDRDQGERPRPGRRDRPGLRRGPAGHGGGASGPHDGRGAGGAMAGDLGGGVDGRHRPRQRLPDPARPARPPAPVLGADAGGRRGRPWR